MMKCVELDRVIDYGEDIFAVKSRNGQFIGFLCGEALRMPMTLRMSYVYPIVEQLTEEAAGGLNIYLLDAERTGSPGRHHYSMFCFSVKGFCFSVASSVAKKYLPCLFQDFSSQLLTRTK